jgi:hypothetical protein
VTRTSPQIVDANQGSSAFSSSRLKTCRTLRSSSQLGVRRQLRDAQVGRRQLEPNFLGMMLRRKAIADYVRHSFSCYFWGRPMVRVGDSNWR